MTDDNEVIATLKVAGACVGIALLLGCMVVALMLPVYLFAKFAGA